MKNRFVSELSQNLKMVVRPKNTIEIAYGELGETFYILLQGKCSVWIPLPKTKI